MAHIDSMETSLVNTEKDLCGSKHFLETIISNLWNGIIIYDKDLRYKVWNRAMEELTGVPESEVLGRNPLDLFPHLREQGVDRLLHRALAGETVTSPDTPFHVSKTGRKGWIVATYGPHRTADGEIIGVVATIHDITQRKNTEKASQFAEIAIDLTSNATFWVRHDACFVHVNDAASKLLGYSREELLSLSVPDINPNVPQEAWPDLWRKIEQRGSFSFESSLRTKDGSIVLVEITLNHLEFDGNEYSCSSVRDITERKRTEEKLMEAHEELRNAYEKLEQTQRQLIHSGKLASLGSLAAGVSHEILNPLNIITMSLHLMSDDPDTPPEITQELLVLQEQAERINKITQNILYFSRQRKPERSRLDLNEMVRRTLSLIERELMLENIEVELRLSEELAPILVDQDQLNQVLLNLLTNARDAMPDGGRLVVLTETVESLGHQFVELRVEDTGTGIAPENIAKLFDPFFTTKGESGGTGLGLSICHGIVEAHGGSLNGVNLPGGGAAFIMRLPGLDERRRERKVLVVDDEPLFCKKMSRFLVGRGYCVEEAHDGEQALDAYRKNRPDVVLLDLRMPGRDGLDILRELKAFDPTASVIILTAAQEQELVSKARAYGAIDYITKPVDLENLDSSLSSAMGLVGAD